ncbi:uncharacterized protein LOC114181253 isoform X1 [Vigna unguiculata]|uniref:uncharacterized protein LOC114181253 isoform X1 n=1 Tax=Vigna unguiculata TaxID=3917 RepID=UPI0010170E9B|nr:uncharacterized protein LOC114181253 isoform X1 [Vigna unguiculata]
MEMKVSRRVNWWRNMMYPLRRVWFSVATRFGFRKNDRGNMVEVKLELTEKAKLDECVGNKFSGLLKLRHDVRACEYEDIQVMWEMLNRNESEFGHSSKKSNKNNSNNKKKGHCWKLLNWARCAPYYYMCRRA